MFFTQEPTMLNVPEVVLDNYRISPNGFLPGALPSQHLEDPYYEPWEIIAHNLPLYIKTGNIRQAVDMLPTLSTSRLNGEAEWRRAYVVLAFLTHAYVWGGEKPKDILPPAISCPFLELSSRLELPACATYAAVCLWNFSVPYDLTDLTHPEDLSTVTSFTGTKDEEWFFMISVAIEAKGAKLIPLMLDAIHAADINDAHSVAISLNQISEGIHGISKTLKRMYEQCGPAVFFHQIRPFLAGSKSMAAAGLPKGLFYDLGNGQGEWHQYSGGSNAQSSLIQTFDIFLGVEHYATGEAKPTGAVQPPAKNGYLQEMRNYMPGPHRRFLETLTRLSNIRSYAMNHRAHSEVRDAYNTAVMTLGSFRDKHIQLVSRYIIMASKSAPIDDPTRRSSQRVNIATATSKTMTATATNLKTTAAGAESGAPAGQKKDGAIYGTGGTDLIPFLRSTRDATKAAARFTDSPSL